MEFAVLDERYCLCGECDRPPAGPECLDHDDDAIIRGLIAGHTISKIGKSTHLGERTVYRRLERMRGIVGVRHNNGLLFKIGRRLGAMEAETQRRENDQFAPADPDRPGGQIPARFRLAPCDLGVTGNSVAFDSGIPRSTGIHVIPAHHPNRKERK